MHNHCPVPAIKPGRVVSIRDIPKVIQSLAFRQAGLITSSVGVGTEVEFFIRSDKVLKGFDEEV